MSQQLFREYFEILPAAPLLPYIECYWARVSRAEKTPSSHLVLPDGCIDIIFNFGDLWERQSSAGRPANGKRSYIVGTMSAPLIVNSGKVVEFLGVRFRPGKAYKFLHTPASEFTNTSVALNDLWGKNAKILEQQLVEQNKLSEKIQLLEEELLRRLQFGSECDGSFELTLQMIVMGRGLQSIKALSSLLGMSRQHITRKFQQYIGIGPKLFSRIIRFQHMRKNISRAQEMIWCQAALEFGFYDQAHMISDFKEFTGFTPEQYFSHR